MPENTSIEVKEGTLSISSRAFASCRSLTSIIIPESVTSIEDEIETPNYVSDADIGEAVETDDMFESFTEQDENGDPITSDAADEDEDIFDEADDVYDEFAESGDDEF